MNIKLHAFLVIGIIIIATACTSTNPAYTPGNTNGVPQFIPSPAINQYSNSVSQITTALGPVNPYAGITDYVVKGVFGLTGIVAGIVAGYKNRQGVIKSMAAGVVKAGPAAAQAVVDHASTTPHFTAVADAINSQTGANQSLTGVTKTG